MYDDGMTMLGQGHIPPHYRLSQITIPLYLFYGEKDTLIDINNTIRDCNHGYRKDSSEIILKVFPVKHYEHLDFLWADDLPHILFPDVLSILSDA